MSYLIRKDRGNNQYQNLNKDGSSLYNNLRKHSIISSLILSVCLVFLIFSLWNFTRSLQKTERHILFLNTKQSLLQTTSTKFLSFGLDSSLLRNMKKFPLLEKKFINLARHLSPAYVRIGGTSADCLYFNETIDNSSEIIDNDISNFTITEQDFLHLYKFVEKSKLRMLFDFNVLLRNSNGTWNNNNAREILNFAKSQKMSIDWQLGNEPNSFHHVFNINISAQQLAEDYYNLRLLLNEIGFEDSILIGPEANHIGDTDNESQRGDKYVKEFLDNNKNSVNFVSWHQYYLNGREAKVEDFLNPQIFNILSNQIKFLQQAINSVEKNISMWLSETGSAFGGGAPEMSDRFIAGFLYLDKLGYSASVGHQVVIRQSFFGGNYAMVGPDLNPNPDWWLSVFYKEFVSNKVLKLETPNNFGTLRLYAHCTADKSLINKMPAITVYGMNLNNYPIKILIQGFKSSFKNSVIFLYTLTADNLQSRTIKMNGEELKLLSNGDLPPFNPVVQQIGQFITLPAHSMIFMVMHGVKMSACYG
ncbi:heparanase-like [Leptopilina boulardi]|uniref:heparanase-like n=1 Tax=Leptopilina boulardi TaxID=63433 RepID=UPI0021F6195B|nr:heparanase-like [Leptopilina boulardi]